MWDFSLVDPDNRRPVDYDLRTRAIETQEPVAALLARWHDGRVKQQVLARLLADRAASPSLYASGDYQALRPRGALAKHLVAFSRSCGQQRLAVVVPRLLSKLIENGSAPVGAIWQDTAVAIAPGRWQDVITGSVLEIGRDGARAAELFADLPFSVLRAQP
jgi:(1->4)-alpha-D-glucan 1-alpha-D-glucosylmutase